MTSAVEMPPSKGRAIAKFVFPAATSVQVPFTNPLAAEWGSISNGVATVAVGTNSVGLGSKR